jgi:hypothetical protein
MRLTRQAAILPICVFLINLSACGLVFPAAEGRFERTLNVTGSVDLDVTTGSGKIDVRAGNSSVVQIVGLIRANDDWRSNAQEKVRYLQSNPPIEQTGNVIRIGRIENEVYRNNVSISYEIVVPPATQVRSTTGSGSQEIEGVHGPVDAGTGSGSLTMYNIGDHVSAHTGSGRIELDRIAGEVEARTGSGPIRAEHIDGSVRAETGSGSIHVEQTAAEAGGARDVDLHTSSGQIEVSGVSGSLRAKTGSGRITASGMPAGDWELDASSGSVTLQLPSTASFDLVAHSSSGRVTVDHPVTVTGTLGRHEMRGKVRGGGHMIDVRTGSGNIAIQ